MSVAGTAEPHAEGAHVPDAVAPPPGNPRFPLFDSFRAIAALSVLVLHTATFGGALTGHWYRGFFAHLDIGVTMFFVISGFLLYRPMVASRILGVPATRTRDYARRRFLRIVPAYWLALTVLGIFPGLYGVFSGNWWVYYGLLQNYPIYTKDTGCATHLIGCGIDPTWSLAIEVGFYAVLPLFAWAMATLFRKLRSGRWLYAELGVLAVISAISVPILLNRLGSETDQVLWFTPLGHAWWFGLGMALAATSVRLQQTNNPGGFLRGNRSIIPWAAAAILYLLACFVILDPLPGALSSRALWRFEYLVFGLIAALVLLPGIFDHETSGAPRRILQHRVMGWLGLVSYGIFLWHFPIAYALWRGGINDWWPAMAFPVITTVTLAITLACASISYYAVERPLMRFKVRSGSRSPT